MTGALTAIDIHSTDGSTLKQKWEDGPRTYLLVSLNSAELRSNGGIVGVAQGVREAAHVRLFGAAPWLAGQLHAAIERYASGITIDLDALDHAVSDAGGGDPAALQQA